MSLFYTYYIKYYYYTPIINCIKNNNRLYHIKYKV